jgi:hypothetical protein
MVNRRLVEEFKKMNIDDVKEFLNASEQESFADDSNVRILLKKYTRLGEDPIHYPIPYAFPYALMEMYIALSHAMYEKYNGM